ncbi:DNA invertase Pin-like site-specific DNA recombinase [Bradyrhizobium yuanmingense]
MTAERTKAALAARSQRKGDLARDTILAAVAEHEREMTPNVASVARDRVASVGQKGHPEIRRLGNPNGAAHLKQYGNLAAVSALKANADDTARRLRPSLQAVLDAGAKSARSVAAGLNARGVLTPRGAQWDSKAVIKLQRRLAALGPESSFPQAKSS